MDIANYHAVNYVKDYENFCVVFSLNLNHTLNLILTQLYNLCHQPIRLQIINHSHLPNARTLFSPRYESLSLSKEYPISRTKT